MKAANGIGPVAYKIDQSIDSKIWKIKSCTVIASESCFARGVDHCLASELDHLTAAQEALYFALPKLRAQLRACNETIDLISAPLYCYWPITLQIFSHLKRCKFNLSLAGKI
jgi:hypothetical protein